MVFHGFWLVSMVLLVENTTKLYPGPRSSLGLDNNDGCDDDGDCGGDHHKCSTSLNSGMVVIPTCTMFNLDDDGDDGCDDDDNRGCDHWS